MRYLVTVSYNGSRYNGWQKQPGLVTLQEVIEKQLSTYFNTPLIIHASGRTDAKVHAIGQTFHFDAHQVDVNKMMYSLNKMLPNDIEFIKVQVVKDSFHARFDAKSKIYIFKIQKSAKSVFLNDQVLFYPFALDIPLLKQTLNDFVGKHSFANFTSKEEDRDNFVREIFKVNLKDSRASLRIEFEGSGFMRGQIRHMIGSLLAIQQGKENSDYIKNNLDQQTRVICNYKVSGAGLYLSKVIY